MFGLRKSHFWAGRNLAEAANFKRPCFIGQRQQRQLLLTPFSLQLKVDPGIRMLPMALTTWDRLEKGKEPAKSR